MGWGTRGGDWVKGCGVGEEGQGEGICGYTAGGSNEVPYQRSSPCSGLVWEVLW